MVWDIIIAAGIGFTQLVLTWYGVHVSVQERRLRNAIVIGIIGALGIGLTVWGAIRNGVSQQKLEADIAELKRGQQATNTGIQRIESTPPTVTVNPQITVPPQKPSASASVVLSHFESAYHETVNGAPTTRTIGFVLGGAVELNFHFVNDGSATADSVKGLGRIYLAPDDSEETEKSLASQFKQTIRSTKWSGIGTISPGGKDEFWFTAPSDRVINQDDLDKLANGTEILYSFVSLTWTDPAGSHYLHRCTTLQPPAFNPEAWHFCRDFSDHR